MWFPLLSVALITLFFGDLLAQKLTPSSGTITKSPRVEHCPFDVKASLAPDVTSLQVTYTAAGSQKALWSQTEVKCYTRILFEFEDSNYSITVQEIEYQGKFQGNGEGKIEALLAWDRDFGPTRFTPITLSSSVSTAIARNTSHATPSECIGWDGMFVKDAKVNLQTTFSGSAADFGTNGVLTQRLKFSWVDPKLACSAHCLFRDIDGGVYDPEKCK
ncbi:uncharacterized protein BDR25DRAFT_338967 [Lindgomyces ingoldianus]|uniref:Uncharacterized protein n=1 Tax=Lindgomyces ingoldianus TaxID=673940 RepID=A0ACB6REC0_9PLEO|nr:uncharacterized protein BDR25DRAFT_338967 [Lindgomyces ingoldianus]KAF2476826.1 hypothetical protein BDR25DRAFT_338967 [Lindgomyces ingoldianus]